MFNCPFFLSGFSFTDTDNSQDSRGREWRTFYSTVPLPPAYEHSDIYLQLCMWDGYHIFLITKLVFTRLLLNEICYLMELLFDWLMMQCLLIFVLDDLIIGFNYQSTVSHTNTFIFNILKILFASVSIVSYKRLCFLEKDVDLALVNRNSIAMTFMLLHRYCKI